MNDERVLGPQLTKDLRDLLAERGRRHAEEDPPHPGGIRERTEHVEHRADPDLAPHGPGMAHGGMKARREHEPDTGIGDATRNRLRTRFAYELLFDPTTTEWIFPREELLRRLTQR